MIYKFSIFIYSSLISVYYFSIFVIKNFHKKAYKLFYGQEEALKNLNNINELNELSVWIHSASVGEFEQAIPLMQKLKISYPQLKLYVSFYSSSGFEQCHKNSLIDYAFYLPKDSPRNAKLVLKKLNPSLVVFVKYDLWFHYLNEIHSSQIPLLLISSIFRKKQLFFKPVLGALHRKMLHFFDLIFVQDENSVLLLKTLIPSHKVILSGDTRFDRVNELIKLKLDEPYYTFFKTIALNKKIIVFGSTLLEDELHIQKLVNYYKEEKDIFFIIVPHSIELSHLNKLKELIPDSNYLSELDFSNFQSLKNCLVVNKYGLLSRLYSYCCIAYVGGGFTPKNGIHNILEPATFGVPILIGNHYEKHKEARDLIALGSCISSSHFTELKEHFSKLLEDKKLRINLGKISSNYIQENKGATEKIIHQIQQNYFNKVSKNVVK